MISPSNSPTVLSLDIGTSSTRAILFDFDGNKIGEAAQLQYAQSTTPDGGVETDAATLFDLTAQCIDRVLETNPHAEIGAVAISCFWHSLLAVDSENNAATPAFSWADNRSAPYVAALQSLLDEDATHVRTGCVLHTSYWPAKLLWLQHSQPELFTSSTRNARWMGFGEYLQLRLFGDLKMSLSSASGSGIFHQNNCDWDDETLRVLPIEKAQLPQLIDCNKALGEPLPQWKNRWPQLSNASWFPAVGDGACSNVGSGCVDENRVALNVGTSGALRVVLHDFHDAAPRGLWRYRVDRNRVLLGGAVSNAGNVWAWCKRNLQLPDDVEWQMSQMPPDAHGLTVLPFLAGERSPLWNAQARFCIEGASLDTSPTEIARASLEACSLRFSAVFELLQSALATSSTRNTQIVASGGALQKSALWSQIVADCLGAPLLHSTESEASARGAALLALESLGIFDLSTMPPRDGETIAPNSQNTTIYERALSRQNALYQKLYG